MTRFDRDTAAEPLGEGRYGVRFDPAWWIQRGPNGGIVAAMMARAMEAEVGDPARGLRSLTVHFLAVPREGPAQVAVTVERSGRSLSTVSARMADGERTLALGLAAFAAPYPAVDEYHHVRSPLPPHPPPELPPPPAFEGAPRFSANYRMLPALGHPPFSGAPEAHTGGWIELAEPRPLDAALAVALTDAWWPAPFARVEHPVPAPTIDLTVHVRAPLPQPAGPVLLDSRSTVARDGFFEEDVALFAPDGTLIAQSRQLALLIGG